MSETGSSVESYSPPDWWSRLALMEPSKVRSEGRKVYHEAGLPFCVLGNGGMVLDFGGLTITPEAKQKVEALACLLGSSNAGWQGKQFAVELEPEQLAAAGQLAESLWPLDGDVKVS